MKKLATTFGVLAVLALTAAPSFAANAVRISQVWGGGGSTSATATYNVDYVELFNNSGAAINIGGWVIEYGSATGTWGGSAGTGLFTFPANTLIQPCKYILVQMGNATAGGGPLPVTADFFGTISMSGGSGKVALFNALNANTACGSELAGTLVDKMAYGTATCAEVTATGGFSINLGAGRNGGGTVDTDNNANDFTVGLLVPRNSASEVNATCRSTPTSQSTWGSVKSIYR